MYLQLTGLDLRFLDMDDSTIVGFHASCHPERQRLDGSWTFAVLEFALTASGDRILLRSLGWSSSGRGLPTTQDALATMRQVLLPDEASLDDGGHPWETIRAAAFDRGLTFGDVPCELSFSYAVDSRFVESEQSN